MWLNVILAKLTSKKCWSAVQAPSYCKGGPTPPAGAPRDVYTQLLACSSSQSVVTIACCSPASLYLGFPIPPSLLRFGQGKHWVGTYSTELFSVTVPGGGRSQGCHGYLLLMRMLDHCPAPPTLQAPTSKVIYW